MLGWGWNDSLGSFLEVACRQIASSEHGGNVVTIDTGLAWLIRPNWQWDFALVFGANDNTPDWAATIGLSGRFGAGTR